MRRYRQVWAYYDWGSKHRRSRRGQRLITRAAEGGSPLAMEELFLLHGHSPGGRPRVRRSAYWLRRLVRSALKRNPLAARLLAGSWLPYSHWPIPVNFSRALSWLRLAVRGGDCHAHYLLDQWFRAPTDEGMAYRRWLRMPATESSLTFLNQIAEAGNAEAVIMLTAIHHESGSKPNRELHDHWRKRLRQAAESGSAEAQYEISSEYLSADAGGPHYDRVKYWLMKAAENGHAEAAFDLWAGSAAMEITSEERYYWLDKAAELKHPDALVLKARSFWRDERRKALKLIEEAARGHQPPALADVDKLRRLRHTDRRASRAPRNVAGFRPGNLRWQKHQFQPRYFAWGYLAQRA